MVLSRSNFSKLTTTTPPKRGPHSKGLNIKDKKVTTIKAEKLNGRNRQNITQRFTRRKTT